MQKGFSLAKRKKQKECASDLNDSIAGISYYLNKY